MDIGDLNDKDWVPLFAAIPAILAFILVFLDNGIGTPGCRFAFDNGSDTMLDCHRHRSSDHCSEVDRCKRVTVTTSGVCSGLVEVSTDTATTGCNDDATHAVVRG